MKEFIEKLIGRLEEQIYDMEICEEQFDMNSPYFMDVEYKMVKIDDIKEIVNQLAEEYGKDTNVTTNADFIRKMNDEELAEFLINFKNTFGEEHEGQQSCVDWLQSEVKGSDV